jgi:hypothetical protein
MASSTPFISGIATSVINSDGQSDFAAAIASSGAVKAVALNPERFRIAASVDAMVGSLSTT